MLLGKGDISDKCKWYDAVESYTNVRLRVMVKKNDCKDRHLFIRPWQCLPPDK